MFRYFTVFAICFATVNSGRFKVIREWKYLNFTWPTEELYNSAFSSENYIPENNIVSGLNYFEDYYYLTLPRMKSGVPATLVRIPAGPTNDTSPALEPYPSWEMNKEGDCNALQNVQNIEIDPNGQLWIIDNGRTETLTNPSSRCPAKLLIFDIKKNMTTTAYTFPENVASLQSNFLYDIVVDDTDGGYAYITDNSIVDPGIIVFSMKDHHSWKIRHSQSMRSDPKAVHFSVNGILINSPLNLASIALGPKIHKSPDRIIVDEDRELYYSPISSLHLYSINTTVLRNEENGKDNGEYQGNVKDYGTKGSQSAGMIMDNQGILYYTLLGTNSIAKWDSHTSFALKQRIISRDEKFLEWPNALTFDQSGNITILVNRLNRFISDQMNITKTNFRLIASHVGGNSYLFNDAYSYNIDANATKTKTENEAPEPQVLPGSDNDPYLIPHAIPERIQTTSTSTEPVSESTTKTYTENQTMLELNKTIELESNLKSVTSPTPTTASVPEPVPEPEPTSSEESVQRSKIQLVLKNITELEALFTFITEPTVVLNSESRPKPNMTTDATSTEASLQSSSSKLMPLMLGIFNIISAMGVLLFGF